MSLLGIILTTFWLATGVEPSHSRTSLEVSAFLSMRNIDKENEKQISSFVFSLAPEYSFRFISVSASLPVVLRQGQFLISDISSGVKVSLPTPVVKPTFAFTVEFPSGASEVTSNHFELFPWARFDVSLGLFEFSVFGSWRKVVKNFSPPSTNFVFPHTENEISSRFDMKISVLPFLFSQVGIGFDLEDMSKAVFSPFLFLGASFNVKVIKVYSKLGGTYYLSGVRKGLLAGVVAGVEF